MEWKRAAKKNPWNQSLAIGNISMGLVNIPVRAIPITVERKVSFRMLHRKCSTPISYRLFCEEGDEVPKSEISFGYKLKGHDYLSSTKKR